SLLLEALQAPGVRGKLHRQDLDRDLAAEPGVAGAIDLAHSARTERSEDLVMAQPGSDGKCHREGASLLRRILPPGRVDCGGCRPAGPVPATFSECLRARERDEPAAAALQIRPQSVGD